MALRFRASAPSLPFSRPVEAEAPEEMLRHFVVRAVRGCALALAVILPVLFIILTRGGGDGGGGGGGGERGSRCVSSVCACAVSMPLLTPPSTHPAAAADKELFFFFLRPAPSFPFGGHQVRGG